jgi:hypothetical protein
MAALAAGAAAAGVVGDGVGERVFAGAWAGLFPKLHHVMRQEGLPVDARTAGSTALTPEQAQCASFAAAPGVPYVYDILSFENEQEFAEDDVHHVIVSRVKYQYGYLVPNHFMMEIIRSGDRDTHVRTEIKYSGSDGANYFYQCARDVLHAGFLARVAITEFVPGSMGEKVWFFKCFLRTARARTTATFGALLGQVGHRGEFAFSQSLTRGWIDFTFWNRAAAESVMANEQAIRQAAHLEPLDMGFGPVQEAYERSCSHNGEIERVRNNEQWARCTGCGQIVGLWEEWAPPPV